jgi:hypothetical protein
MDYSATPYLLTKPVLIDLRKQGLTGPQDLCIADNQNTVAWTNFPLPDRGLPLINGPSTYITWINNSASPSFEIPNLRGKSHGWCQEVSRLGQARTSRPEGELWLDLQCLKDEILNQLLYEETELHPVFNDITGTDRITRELRYEQAGIHHYLNQSSPAVFASSQTWSKFLLDCVHLAEHNLDRKLNSLVPVLRAYLPREKRKRLEEWLRR